jgi:hypothetical protein
VLLLFSALQSPCDFSLAIPSRVIGIDDLRHEVRSARWPSLTASNVRRLRGPSVKEEKLKKKKARGNAVGDTASEI